MRRRGARLALGHGFNAQMPKPTVKQLLAKGFAAET
jgi:hypothetical protein